MRHPIRITETKQTLKLETVGVHDRHSHIGGKMQARKSAPGVGGFLRPESKASAPGGWSSIKFSRYIVLTLPGAGDERNDLRCIAANVVFELIRAAEPSCPVLEELHRRGNESAITGFSYAASESKKLNLKPIHSKAIASRLDLYLTVYQNYRT